VARRPQSKPPVLPGFAYVRPLGAGGFADVFLYEQDMPRRVVAVKVLTVDAVNPDARIQFAAEADVMARLSAHPSILTIHEASISSDGRPYLVTEFCPESMGERYKQAPLPVGLVLDAGVRMAGALETAHRSGVLHRDIKPSNILITTLGQPVLADFGIAAAIQPLEDEDQFVAMSVPWSSPEVVTEVTAGTVPSEVWSLGATLYTLLAGRSPFAESQRERNTRELMRARVAKGGYTPIGRAEVPRPVEALLARTMSLDPARRPQSMRELGEELRALQGELGLIQTPLEVIAEQYATAMRTSSFSEGAAAPPRGPVVATVQRESRRLARSRRPTAPGAAAVEEIEPGTGRPAAWRWAVIGAAIGLAVAGAVVLALVVSGVLG